jgi:putative endonuclease
MQLSLSQALHLFLRTFYKTQHIALGIQGELVVYFFLQRNKYKILNTNWKTRSGEIDIIASKNSSIIFCEVKTRKTHHADIFSPFDAITNTKINTLKILIEEYMTKEQSKLKTLKINNYRLDLYAVEKISYINWYLDRIKLHTP